MASEDFVTFTVFGLCINLLIVVQVDQPSQAVLAVVTGHEGPYLPNQACLHSTSEPDNCDKRPAEYSPQAREVACKRTRESMHDDSLEKQNVPTQGTYDTELAEADLQASTLACSRVVSKLLFYASHWDGCILIKPLWSNGLSIVPRSV